MKVQIKEGAREDLQCPGNVAHRSRSPLRLAERARTSKQREKDLPNTSSFKKEEMEPTIVVCQAQSALLQGAMKKVVMIVGEENYMKR